MDYELIDSGLGRKLERFSSVTLNRPCSQAVWLPKLGKAEWANADASYTREEHGKWEFNGSSIDKWLLEGKQINYQLSLTPFGHLGFFLNTIINGIGSIKPMVKKVFKTVMFFIYLLMQVEELLLQLNVELEYVMLMPLREWFHGLERMPP